MSNSWKEQLLTALIKEKQNKTGTALFEKYKDAFLTSYQEECSPTVAVSDILQLEVLSKNHPLEIAFYETKTKAGIEIHIRLFQLNQQIPLSDMLPVLEDLNLRTLSERPYALKLNGNTLWISDFTVKYLSEKPLELDVIRPIFKEAFVDIISGMSESDGFNKLVLGAELNISEIVILRMYAKYLQQIGFRFSQPYIEKTLANHPELAGYLITLFKLKFDPKQKSSANALKTIEDKIKAGLEQITSLDEDRIIRFYWQLIQATIRTNFYQMKDGKHKAYLSIKLRSDEVPELPLPKPLYEIFVYATHFEGIHLRSAKVARGGIRWSDRREDFRTEILGLMKAQKVKNAVIVPSGAKGGFVLKALPSGATRDIIQQEVIKCYRHFISGLLDITDNIVDDKVVRPNHVVCYDDNDPYLVVAADKGTATFSDLANSISKEYHFWLGDAFASGGSAGYDHKKMGITARGAWESIRRHFRELDINIDTTDITVVGIGDMSGDVFGNGMIYTPHIKLIAAFDHRDIFIDPNPDPKKSFNERERMFNLPQSSWQDYNAKLISKGGGVFKRSSKSITLSPEIKKCLNVQENTMTPNELIKAILKAPVDLLYNGGIGTYVKATQESQADVGDKTNEFCRVNGDDLRCRVVGEGGNLGFTQLGRVEYALKGGLINTDFIDNSAGVDCSDHEVNIKIILDKVVKEGKLTEKKRDQVLASMTDEVGKLVLRDNYNQALAMSFSGMRTSMYAGLYQSYIKDLEAAGIINRAVEFLPTEKTLLDRKAAGIGLTRPEVAVLLAYTKIHIKNEILKSNLPEDPYFLTNLQDEFPSMFDKKYQTYLLGHPLHREIIATQISNHIVNEMGITFAYRMQMETGATIAEIIKAHAISAHVFDTAALMEFVESLGFKITVSLQYELLHYIRQLLNLSTRWFIRSPYLRENIDYTIGYFSESIKKIKAIVPELMAGTTREYLHKLAEHFISSGLSKEQAYNIAVYRALYTSLNIIEVASKHKYDMLQTAKIYFDVGSKFNLVWFRDQIATDSREGHWNSLARLTLRDELDVIQRLLTVVIMKKSKKDKNVRGLIESWIKSHPRPIERWERLLQMLHGNETVDYTMFYIALRELADWVHAFDTI